MWELLFRPYVESIPQEIQKKIREDPSVTEIEKNAMCGICTSCENEKNSLGTTLKIEIYRGISIKAACRFCTGKKIQKIFWGDPSNPNANLSLIQIRDTVLPKHYLNHISKLETNVESGFSS